MASITGGKKGSGGGPGPKALPWMNDFCHELQKTYGIENKDRRSILHKHYVPSPNSSIPDCDGMVYWLNMFDVLAAPAAPSAPMKAKLPSPIGSNAEIDIQPDKIESSAAGGAPITMQTSFEMALLAAANPNMAGESLKLTGNANELKMLTFACMKAGLTVKNPAKIDPKEMAAMETKWETFYGDMRTNSVAAYDAKEYQLKRDMIENTPDPDAQTELASAGVSDATFKEAKEKIWGANANKISRSNLQAAFAATGGALTDAEADAILRAMAKDNFATAAAVPGNYEIHCTADCFWRPDFA